MADVFISYKQRMRPRVAQIAQALQDLGLTVWFDAELQAGRSFGAVINTELSRAGCVIVCWTPDAFAPEDGSEVSWVEAEASVARERKVIVPIMLERTPLRAPWNMFHTERLVDWTPDKPDDPAWQRVLEVIGGHVGRPNLAAEALALGKDGARPAARRRLPRANAIPKASRWLLGAGVLVAIGSVLLNLRLGTAPLGDPESYALDAGPVVSSLVFAIALWRGGALDFGRSVFSIVAGIIGYVAALFTLPLVGPLAAAIGIGGDMATSISQSFLAATVGALVALAGVALLMGNVGSRGWSIICAGSLVLGLLCGAVGSGMLYGIYPRNLFWITLVWSLGYGVLLALLAASRPARTM